jgi:hypothetical protein
MPTNTDTDIYMRSVYREAFALAEKAALDLDGTLTLARRLAETVLDCARQSTAPDSPAAVLVAD